jgi:ABC-type dipeptide/oligopeptide/nickel transport system ATPase component
MDEEKLEIKPELIEQIHADNQNTPPELENFRSDYASIFTGMQPQSEQHLNDARDEIQENTDSHFKKLRTLPRTEKSPDFPIFEDWVKNVDIESIKQQIKINADEITKKNPDKTYSQDDLKEILDNKLQYFYHQAALLHKYNTEFGINLDYNNPEDNFNKFMSDYSSSLVEHLSDKIPDTINKGTITYVIGYSGAGKSSAIGEVQKIPNTPFEINQNGSLVLDSDNVQPFIPGYAGGAGSQNTSAYALSIHRQLLQKAMQDNKDVVIPIVGGQLANMTSEIARALLSGYDNVKIKLVNTPAHVSYQNVVNRAMQEGARIIPPTVGQSSNPSAVFETLSGLNARSGEKITDENLDDVKRKILDTIIKELGGKKKADPQELQNRMQPFNNIEDKVQFELVQTSRPNLAKLMLQTIRIAQKFEMAQKYAISDRLIRISMTILNKNRLFKQ